MLIIGWLLLFLLILFVLTFPAIVGWLFLIATFITMAYNYKKTGTVLFTKKE